MHESPPLGRHLPGWGQALRATPRRSAMALATMAGVALAGCQQAPVAMPTAASALQVSLSQPLSLRGALRVALQHIDRLRTPPNAEPFHLVAFRGERLDDSGRTVAAHGSAWTFTFSRYNAPPPAADYDVVEVFVPGTGYTALGSGVSSDLAVSPIENWDGLFAEGAPDSAELVWPLKAKGVAVNGASISLAKGVVTIQADGKTATYSTAEGAFSAIP